MTFVRSIESNWVREQESSTATSYDAVSRFIAAIKKKGAGLLQEPRCDDGVDLREMPLDRGTNQSTADRSET